MKVYSLCDDRCAHLADEIDRLCRVYAEVPGDGALVVFPCGDPPEVVEFPLTPEVYQEVRNLEAPQRFFRLLRYVWELLPGGPEAAKLDARRSLN